MPPTLQLDALDQRIGFTNALLPNNEIKQVKERFQARMRDVLRIDKLIRNGHGTAQHLEHRSQLVEILTRYQVVLAPHKRLPVEILQQIFRYVCQGYNDSFPRYQDPPLLLCRVCSSWRFVIINMPEIWKSLHFFTGHPYSRSQKLDIVRLWFSRAGSLDLSLTLTDEVEDTERHGVDFLKGVIAPFSKQFIYLHLVLPTYQIQGFFSLPPGSLDALEALHVVNLKVTMPSIPQWTSSLTLPSLRRLRLHLNPLLDPKVFVMPWHQLEIFQCDSNLQLEDCHHLLLNCQKLTMFHVRIYGIKYTTPFPYEIHLPHLINLSVYLCDKESYDLFFLPLILPSLRSLTLYHFDGLSWSSGMYTNLLDRSKCSLEELYLGTVDARPDQVIRILELTPLLRSITFSHKTDIPPEVYARIGRAEFGQHLEQLFLKGTRRLEPILNMLEMRQVLSWEDNESRSAISKLTFIETFCSQDEIKTHSHRIQSLQNNGVIISLLNSPEGYFLL